MIVDLAQIAPTRTSIGREVKLTVDSSKVTMYIPSSHRWGGGKESKRVTVNRFIPFDELFMEGLGLWRGEGGKKKGIYFGNSDASLLRRFLDFVEQKIGLTRREFNATINVPRPPDSEVVVIRRWSEELLLPSENFTHICIDPGIKREYTQIYYSSIVLAELLNSLYSYSKEIIQNDPKLCVYSYVGFLLLRVPFY